MDYDEFDYDELRRNVDDLLDDEYGSGANDFDDFADTVFEDTYPDDDVFFRNAANHYGAGHAPQAQSVSDYDEEAAAMHYDPQTNRGAVIRAYNTDYASRAVQRAQKKGGSHPKPSGEDATQQLPRAQQMRMQQAPADTQLRTQLRHSDRPKEMPMKKKRKKHGFLKLLLVLLILGFLAVAALWIFSKQPTGDSLGQHRDGCSAILLAGTDADGTRTDTMMLLYMDEKAGEMNLLSLPRDTYVDMDVSVPKLNGVYGLAGGGKEGMERLLDYTEQCIGYRPDGYVLIDLDCFENLVNLMGGVQFDVPCDMRYEDPAQDLYIDLKAGEQKLNGKEAMWVVRFRSGYAMADLKRVEVQRDFIRAALGQWLALKNVWKAPAAAALVTANTTTNLSAQELAWLAKTAKAIGTENMHTETLPGEATYINGGSYYITWPETTANLINAHYNPYDTDVSYENIYSLYY